MANKIAFFTSCRGDIGILSPLIKQIYKSKNIDALLFVGGTHLVKKYGYTIAEIRKEGLKITETYNYVSSKDDPYNLSKTTNKSGIQVSKFFKKYNFNFVCILGDRYERVPIILNSIIFKKPIIHLHGGEITQGLIDEQIRHLISKAAHLHFVICNEYKKNLLSLGEDRNRIHNSGALAIDNIKQTKKENYKNILKEIGLDPNLKFAILTYHPVSLEFNFPEEKQIQNIFESLKRFDLQIIVTSPGVEVGSNKLIKLIKEKMQDQIGIKAKYVESLGFTKLYSLIPHCSFVIGNSSFGIIEVPYFKIPTINIGDRQKGRFNHKSIINSGYDKKSIIRSIKKSENNSFKKDIKKMNYMFGKGDAAKKIIRTIKKIKINQNFLQKPFIRNV